MLYVVSTPIGNLGDISSRALETLRAVDIIAAEDTRVTRKLLSHFAVRTPQVSYHGHSGPEVAPGLIRRMQAGQSVALVTDAGTPAISDPGTELVAAAIAADIRVVPIPGASAAITALVGSGLPTSRFVFEGFLPRTKGSRLSKLAALAAETRTVVLYESAQRIAGTLAEASAAFGADRAACLAREITKKFEEFRRGTLGDLAAHYASQKTRGECALVVSGAPAGSHRGDISRAASSLASDGDEASDVPRGRDLVRLLAQEIGVSRRDLYQLVLQLKRPDSESGR